MNPPTKTMKAKPQKPIHSGFLSEQVRLLKSGGWIAHAKEFEAAITALQIIHTWATFDGGRCLDPHHVEKLTKKALKGFIASSPKPRP
jgi:hypothetical protein